MSERRSDRGSDRTDSRRDGGFGEPSREGKGRSADSDGPPHGAGDERRSGPPARPRFAGAPTGPSQDRRDDRRPESRADSRDERRGPPRSGGQAPPAGRREYSSDSRRPDRRDDRRPDSRADSRDERRGPPREVRSDGGRLDQRTTRPPNRRIPKSEQVQCRHFPACVGCPGMGRSYTKQLTAKHERVLGMIREATEIGDVQFLSPVGSPRQTGYRNHAKLVFRHRRNRESHEQELILGVYKPTTHSVMPAESCIVHHRRIQPLLRSLLEEVQALEISIYDERTRQGALRYALARTSDHAGLTHLTLVSATDKIAKLNTLVLRLQHRHRELESVFLCVNDSSGNNLLSPDIRQIKGPPALREKFGDLVLESRAGAFLQANTEVASRIYSTAAKWLNVWAADGVVDLYCGVGALGLSSINQNTRLLGIEASEAAIECAQANAKRLKRHRAEFVAGPAENVLEIATGKGFLEPSALIINPPRKGLSRAAGEAIVKLGPRKILYVSCEPETLVRDLKAFAAEGWATRRVRVYDMLPQTPHVEVMALLERTPPAMTAISD